MSGDLTQRKRRIVVNPEVRRLLAELAELFDRSDALTEKLLPGSPLAEREIMNAGAEREHVKSLIQGLAWQIHCAATGEGPKAWEKERRRA